MTQQIDIIKGDTLEDLIFALKDADDIAVDLSTASSARFNVQKADESELKFSGVMESVGNPADGIVKYITQATDFDEVGTFFAEIEITFYDGKILTWDNITVTVRGDLPK